MGFTGNAIGIIYIYIILGTMIRINMNKPNMYEYVGIYWDK